MSWAGAYREIKIEYDSEDNWEPDSINDCQTQAPINLAMDANHVQALIANAVSQALAQQEENFQSRFNAMQDQIKNLSVETPQI